MEQNEKVIQILKTIQQLTKIDWKENYLDNCAQFLKNENKEFSIFTDNIRRLASIQVNSKDSILLVHQTGSGKTAMTINLLKRFPSQKKILIIGNADIIEVWKTQLQQFGPDIINRVTFQDIDSFTQVLPDIQDYLVVFDEIHNFTRKLLPVFQRQRIKNEKIQKFYEIYQKLLEYHPQIIALSATPLTNEPFELSLLMNLLKPGSLPLEYQPFYDYLENVSDYELKKILFPYFSYLVLREGYTFAVQRKTIALQSFHSKLLHIANHCKEVQEKVIVFCQKINVDDIKSFFQQRNITFGFYTGVNQSIQQRTQTLETFNAANNVLGQKMQVLFLTKIGKEGITVLDTRFLFFIDLFSNYSTEQMIGRINRLCSLYQLMETKPNIPQVINIINLFSQVEIMREKKNIDLLKKIRHIQRLIRESSVGCFFTEQSPECFTLPQDQFIEMKKKIPVFLSGTQVKGVYEVQQFTKVLVQNKKNFLQGVKKFFYVLINSDYYAYNFRYKFFLGRLFVSNGVPLFYKHGKHIIYVLDKYY